MATVDEIEEFFQKYDFDNKPMLSISFDENKHLIQIEIETYYACRRRPRLAGFNFDDVFDKVEGGYESLCANIGFWLFMVLGKKMYNPTSAVVYFFKEGNNPFVQMSEYKYIFSENRIFVETISLPSFDVDQLAENMKLQYQVGQKILKALGLEVRI